MRIATTNMIGYCLARDHAMSLPWEQPRLRDGCRSERISKITEFPKKVKGQNLTHASQCFRIAVIVSPKNSVSTAAHRHATQSNRPN